ncbi:MAG TPA: PrsW family glutamic-type intramembrane protease [Kineosporiaceae bacterium]
MSDWFMSVDGQVDGPHSAAHVIHWLRSGQVPQTALLWPADGSSAGWLPVPEAWSRLAGSASGGAAGVPSGSASVGAPGGDAGSAGPANGSAGPANGSAVTVSTRVSPAMGPVTGRTMIGFAPGVGPIAQHPSSPLSASPVRNPIQVLADFAGVDRLEGFRLGELLSATFSRKSREEIELHFATGLPGTTPEVHAIEPGWPKPWMFVRLLGTSMLLFVSFVLLIQVFNGGNLLPGLIVIGSFAVPLSVLVFFFEVNSPRNVSLYRMIHCLLIGGLISLAVTLLLEEAVGHLGGVGVFVDPVTIGVAEEVAKLLAVFLITVRLPPTRYPWILNGMLFGAAVGAGFACFESAGYAFYSLLNTPGPNPPSAPNLSASINTIILRGALAPFGHVVWTALAAGALWRVKLARGLEARMLFSHRVARMLLVVVALHAMWDFDYTARLPFYAGQLALGVLAWLLAFGMLQNGLKQIKAAQAASPMGYLRVSGATSVFRTVGQIGP